MEKLHVNRNTEKQHVSSAISTCFFSVYISLRSNQNWSEQYGTLRTNNSAVNRAFGRTQLCALRREGNAEATQYISTKENPLMPTLRAWSLQIAQILCRQNFPLRSPKHSSSQHSVYFSLLLVQEKQVPNLCTHYFFLCCNHRWRVVVQHDRNKWYLILGWAC